MIGTVLAGRYEVSALVADGPIFSLFRARDRITGRDVSLRLVRSPFDGQQEFVDALGKAVEKVASIGHANVERLIELDRYEGQTYIVGEWTQAPALADRIRKLAPFSAPVAVAAALAVCRGLDAFHKLGVVHGDVGPSTACLMADGEVRLQMGGLWEAYSSSPTAGAMVLPTLAPALAPEVGKGAMPSLRSDVYAVGVLLYELLTGRKPYIGDTPLATAMRHSTDPTPHVRSLNPSVPMVLDEIVAKAMDKEAENRYASAGEMAADLRLIQDALRFGRTLSWPLRAAGASAPPARTPSQGRTPKAAAPGRVAPKMTAIRDEDDEDFGKRERDVPAWASIGLALVACVAVSLLAVYFVLNLNRPRLVAVPSLNGLTTAEARTSLERNKLQMRVDSDKKSNDKVAVDHIVESDPPERSRVREGSTVMVELSAGPAQVSVPDLVGLTPDSARSQLEKIGLKLDDTVERQNRPPAKEGTILAQSPEANKSVAREGMVKVTIQDGSQPAPEIHSFEYNLKDALSDLTKSARVKVEVEDIDGVREVFNRRRSPGETLEVPAPARGDKAVFRIYYDGKRVRTVTQKSDGSAPETTTP